MKYFFNVCIILFSVSPIFTMDSFKPQPNSIMYAPWREQYANMMENSETKNPHNKPCIFCSKFTKKDDTQNFILYRGKHSFIMLASQPYVHNGIHFLIVPYEHTREISDLSAKTYKEEYTLTQKLCALFSHQCNEIYINTNQGSSAGASIPNHHHQHIIINKSPRYYNLIHALQETKTTIDLPSLFHTLQSDITALHTTTIPQPLNKNLCNKNCYYCSVIKNDTKENLIIYRDKHASIMLSHYPTYFGEIDIIPNEHIESLETMPIETYEEINDLTVAIYPILLKLLQTQDSNIGLISYGVNAPHKEHIKQKIIPRKNTWNTTSTTRAYHLNGNITNFYNKLLSEWQQKLLDNNHSQQSSKL